jgi:hypothetical protein
MSLSRSPIFIGSGDDPLYRDVTFGDFQRARDFRAPRQAREASMASLNLGGEYRARTGDLLVANQALSQLS